MGWGLYAGPRMVVVLMVWVEDVGVGVVEVDCMLVAGIMVLLGELVELDLRVASDPPTPPPTALAMMITPATTTIQNVFFRRPHIVRVADSTCARVMLPYAILSVSVGATE